MKNFQNTKYKLSEEQNCKYANGCSIPNPESQVFTENVLCRSVLPRKERTQSAFEDLGDFL